MEELKKALAEEAKAHRKTIALLKAIVEGNIDVSRVTVTDEGWTLAKPS